MHLEVYLLNLINKSFFKTVLFLIVLAEKIVVIWTTYHQSSLAKKGYQIQEIV
jgi:hypothetical protein